MKAFGVLWVGCECHRNPLFLGVGPEPMGVFWGSLVETRRNRVVPVEAFLRFHKDKRWTELAMEDKGPLHALGGSSRDPEEVECREKSKLTKMAWSGSLAPWPLTPAPCSVNNYCVAAEWQPTPVFCLENSMERGAWGATVHGVAKTWIRLSNAFTFTVTRRCRQNKTIVHISTVCSGIWPNLQHITLLPTHVYTLTF